MDVLLVGQYPSSAKINLGEAQQATLGPMVDISYQLCWCTTTESLGFQLLKCVHLLNLDFRNAYKHGLGQIEKLSWRDPRQ